ncbi:uncharacterized protein LOC121428993 [Lytechinus variegatus]|uniref:uncharacterized protein LOC121428993 n=1 Tax=Lytechinus variegatus TaxID=7654 RepID=UPI001BB1AC4B|nr:uncharacterized protein LOC121428993 [Lytechinus variegatus]
MVQKAKSHNIHLLLSEFPGSPHSAHIHPEVGPLCQESGITKDHLMSPKPSDSGVISVTNAMIIELFKYRERSGTTWETVANKWWPNLFDCHRPLGTIYNSWCQVLKKHRQLPKEEQTDFEAKTYTIPPPKPARCTAQADGVQCDGKEDHQDDILDDCSEVDLDCFPDRVSDHTIDSIVNCMQLLANFYEDSGEDHECTKRELAECKKREKMLQSAYDDLIAANDDLKQCLSILKRKNIVRRLHRREELEEKNETIQKLHRKIEQLEVRLKNLQKSKKNMLDSRRHFRLNTKNFSAVKKELSKKILVLEQENDHLKSELDGIMADKEVRAFENGRYSNDIRLVCYELIARGVGSKHVSDIIRIVLKDICKMKIGRLPKPTLIRYLAVEQALLNKECARAKIHQSETPVTLHTDGTTKKRKGYVTFLASTKDQTVGMSLHDIEVETGESLLTDTRETLEELVRLNLCDDVNEVHRLLAKFKTTMTDRSIVNKLYINKLELWRSNILPQVIENWESLDDGVKQEIATINDLYCGKHLVLNLQEYSASALCEWEKVEANEGKLGREKQVLWNRSKTESASLLAVRSFCNLLGPDCDEQSGLTEEFKTIVQKSSLVAYRGNRFNVPFHNSAAVYHHISDFHTLCASLDSKREGNMYVKSLKADFDDDIVVSGIRAMGIINQHISAPLMRMLESHSHVMDTDQHYTRLHDKVQEWMVDPSPLLTDSSILFPAFPPVKDSIHKSLYDPCSANIEHLTKQALMIILHNCLVCITRQLSDHLPGGRFHSAPENIRKQTASCPKDNLCAERMFAGLDYLKRKMPNANTVALEGILLWSLNKTRDYLDEMSDEKKDQYLSEAVRQRKSFLQLYQGRSKAIKEKIAEKLLLNKRRKEDKLKEIAKQRVQMTSEALQLCGMLCTSNDDVDELKQRAKDFRQLEKFLIAQIKYLKSTSTGGVKMELFHLTKGKN